MNVAVILAGGIGTRMSNATIPKQFLELHGKPILVYTIEHFQTHEMIDKIILVCVNEWKNHCLELVKKYSLDKVKRIVSGGANGFESIHNGLIAAQEISDEDAIVLIHDGVRPLVDKTTISKCIESVKKNGSAITVNYATETVGMCSEQNDEIKEIFERKKCILARAPQCFYLKEIVNTHSKALDDGKSDFVDSADLMQYYGHSLAVVNGPIENIKITTPTDFYIFRAMIDAKENAQIFC